VVEPTPITVFKTPVLNIVPLAVVFNPTPDALTVGAVDNAEPSITTIVPTVALARVADAPEIVAALPADGVI
jgi:hypothetical protein